MQIRLIDQDGKQIGLIDRPQAEKIAEERDLDLVAVAGKASPPVYRLMDYGKRKYLDHKKEKKQKRIKIKGIRLGFRTGEHDLEMKAKQVDKFLSQNNKVKIEIFLRGREKAFRQPARKLLEKFLERLTDNYKLEQNIKSSPRGFNLVLCPSSKPKNQSANDSKLAKEKNS